MTAVKPAVTTCHCAVANTGAGPDAAVVALVGAPNSGKSTLFNALTGARTTVGNWPGTTVEVARGVWRGRTLIDLPGAYSLDPLSPDEALTRDLLVSDPDDRPDLVVVVADAANLARSLYLVSEVRERAQRVIVALTMLDVAERRGIAVDTAALAAGIGCPVVALDPRRRSGLGGLADAVAAALAASEPAARRHRCCGDALEKADERFGWVAAAVDAGVTDAGEDRVSSSDRFDRIAIAPLLGPLLFLGVMWLVFQVTTTVAAPLQDFFDTLFSGPITDAALAGFAAIGLEGSWVEGLVVDGLIAGVGMVLTFVPLMALMFVLLALLEDSGYLARAAVVTDRLMRAIGLPGKAFLPLVVGFGCNVPAISATRILSDGRQRLLTALLVPFTSCTARLTVFVLLGTVFFGQWAGTVVFAMYVASILLVVGVGLLLRRTLWRTMGAEPLVIDLPPYQLPTLRLTATVAWTRLAGFLRTASGIIVVTVCAVWLLQSVPAHGGAGFGEVDVEDSVYGVAAQAITPAFAPAGFAQWQTTSALVVGFVAKEAVISSWAQTYALDEPADGGDPGSLGDRIMADFTQSSGGHPIPAALAFMIFLMAYTPCVATLAAQWREIGGRWTVFGIAVQLAVAWGLAVLVFQVGSLWW
jgi:ferrous iron transport protein B